MKELFTYIENATNETNLLIEKFGSIKEIPSELVNNLLTKYPLYNVYKEKINLEKRKIKVTQDKYNKQYFYIGNIKFTITVEYFGYTNQIAKKFITDELGNTSKLILINNKVECHVNNLLICTYRDSKAGFSKDAIIDTIKLLYLQDK